MNYVSVDVYVLENDTGEPIEGVMVRVFDVANRVFFTQAPTDATGRAGFTLYPQDYILRFFKPHVQVKQPLVIKVTEPAPGMPELNVFEATAELMQQPVSSDARLCTASGFFRDITGRPDPNVIMSFSGGFDPILLAGDGVISERRALRTGADGYACIDLIRCACYTVILQGYEEKARHIQVPDLPSVNLPDLLFPVVDRVVYDSSTTTMMVGTTLVLTPTVSASNQVPLQGTATGDVLWTSSDESVFSVAASATTLTLLAKSRGSANLIATRLDKSIIRIPQQAIIGGSLPITVT